MEGTLLKDQLSHCCCIVKYRTLFLPFPSSRRSTFEAHVVGRGDTYCDTPAKHLHRLKNITNRTLAHIQDLPSMKSYTRLLVIHHSYHTNLLNSFNTCRDWMHSSTITHDRSTTHTSKAETSVSRMICREYGNRFGFVCVTLIQSYE